jgi:hypothetical protein
MAEGNASPVGEDRNAWLRRWERQNQPLWKALTPEVSCKGKTFGLIGSITPRYPNVTSEPEKNRRGINHIILY